MDVSNLVNYANRSYPNIPGAEQPWFEQEFQAIRNAVNSIETILKLGSIGVTVKSGLPVAGDLAKGTCKLFKDSSGGGVYLAYNDAGTLKKVQLT